VLEAQLIDLADEVAYNSADLDDAFSAGLLTAEAVAGCVPQYRSIFEAVETQYPGATDRERFHEGLRNLIDVLVSGLIEGTVNRAQQSGARDAEDVRNLPGRLAAFTPQVAETSGNLKRFLYERVYASKAVGEERQRSVALIGELFRFFMHRTSSLPEPYSQQAETEPPHRVVCDYIAGMTDGFFYRTYRQMIGPVPD
jgi:dGTPase